MAGGWLWAATATILERPGQQDELDDIFNYFDAWNEYAPEAKKLLPGWIAAQIKDLAGRSPNSPREFRWMANAPPKQARPEYWRKWAGTVDPWAAQASDPSSLMNQLGKEKVCESG